MTSMRVVDDVEIEARFNGGLGGVTLSRGGLLPPTIALRVAAAIIEQVFVSQGQPLDGLFPAIVDVLREHGIEPPAPDACQFCRGISGGVAGNENRFGDVVACDACSALILRILRAHPDGPFSWNRVP